MEKNPKKLLVILGIIVVIIVIIIVAAASPKKTPVSTPGEEINIPLASQPATGTPEIQPGELAPANVAIDVATATPEVLKEATVVAPGTSLITKDNRVVTPEGVPVKLNVDPASAEAPRESSAINPSEIPNNASTVKLSVSAAGFSPSTFTVKEAQLVNFALTSTDSFAHIFLFDDKALVGSILGVAGGETKMKSWNAPKKGEYTFTCSIPGHAGRGETGKMIVN